MGGHIPVEGAIMESLSLTDLAQEHLGKAREGSAGRSAVTVHGHHDFVLRQTLIALLQDQALAEHDSPREATLQVLHGRVRLTAGEDTWEGGVGEMLVIPPARHDLLALEDAVVLLSVGTGA